MKIGLTGSIACGKSTVSHYLRSLGYVVADADAISRALTAAGGAALPHIRSTFGDSVFFPDGTLDRRALGSIVFGNEQRRAELNAILHPLIIGEVTAQVNSAEAKTGIAFADIPLLYECGMETHFDRIWVVSASRDTQIARLFERDGLSPKEACARIDAQMPLDEKCKRADAVITTEGTILDTQAQIDRLLSILP